MKNGIGPQNLGASGMNPKSTPCGHPVASPMKKLEDLSGDGEVTQKDVLIGRGVIDADGDTPNNSGTPLYFQDDISKIQEAASTLEAHNIGGGGGAVQGAAAAAQETAASQMGQSRREATMSRFKAFRGAGGLRGMLRTIRGPR
tara:strand:- start:740 stop:1171 length:432 start_codon:yes stop_codon:yes gene_type:complete